MELSTNANAGVIFSSKITASFIANHRGVCTGGQNLKANPAIGTSTSPSRNKMLLKAASSSAAALSSNMISAYFDSVAQAHVFRFPLQRGSNGLFISPCPGQINSKSLKALFAGPQTNVGYVDIPFDVRMSTLVIGLNSGTLTLDGLMRVENKVSRTLGLIGYMDPFYTNPPMPRPIYCLDKDRVKKVYGITLSPAQFAGPEICFLVSSLQNTRQIFFYPMVMQMHWSEPKSFPKSKTYRIPIYYLKGGNNFFPLQSRCKCPEDRLDKACNANYFFWGMYYDTAFNNTQTVNMGIKLQEVVVTNNKSQDPLNDYMSFSMINVHMLFYFPKLSTPIQSWTDPKTGMVWNYNWANNQTIAQLVSSEFTKICNKDCTMIFFYSYAAPGATSMNMPINEFDLSLRQLNGNSSNRLPSTGLRIQMCSDSFTRREPLAMLSKNPPVKLVQSYYECQNTLTTSLVGSVGNAAATSTLYVGFGWIILGLLYSRYLKMRVQREQVGAVLLTEAVKVELEATHDQIRLELIYEGLKNMEDISQGRPLSTSFVSKLNAFRSLFYDEEANSGGIPTSEQTKNLLLCGKEISARLQNQDNNEQNSSKSQISFMNNPQFHKRITISPPPLNTTTTPLSSPSIRISSRLFAHPNHVLPVVTSEIANNNKQVSRNSINVKARPSIGATWTSSSHSQL